MTRTLALVLLLVSSPALAQVASFTFSDPVPKLQLPPFVDRVPELGDRWVYSTPVPSWQNLETVEVIALEPWGEGWRYLVETSSIARSEVSEWFFRPDGTVLHGDEWRGGALAFDAPRPSVVIRDGAKRRQAVRRSGMWDPHAGSTLTWKWDTGSELRVRHLARLRVTRDPDAGGGPWPAPALRFDLAVRSRSYCKVSSSAWYSELVRAVRRERLVAWYDDELGLVGAERSMSDGCAHAAVERVLLSAEVGGVVFSAPGAADP
jgi:hypothetical protein